MPGEEKNQSMYGSAAKFALPEIRTPEFIKPAQTDNGDYRQGLSKFEADCINDESQIKTRLGNDNVIS